jgi:uncharacterized protein
MTGSGGWPMSVFLTPEGEPFYGGTYYPPQRRYNMPTFREVLETVQRVWKEDRAQIIASGNKVRQYISQLNYLPASEDELKPDILENAALTLGQAYDWEYGGWGSAPKFPQPQAIEFLLLRAAQGETFACDIAIHALEAMSLGGMYDVVGGGFARYSTDNYWLVPHFEKMLYDNAQLALVYLHGYLITGNLDFRRVCEGTLDFLVRELRHPLGGFFSSLDADSEGVEGKYYVWKLDEVRQALDNDNDYEFFSSAYTLSDAGNFEGFNVLHRKNSDEGLAERFGIDLAQVPSHLFSMHKRLLAFRQQRIPPATDDKILVFWNALALRVFAEAARYLQRVDYLEIAQQNAEFLLSRLNGTDRLLRSWRDGKAQHNAFLEDYAALILGLLALYESDHNTRWYASADMLTRGMIDHFRDPQVGFFDTRDDHGDLITRPKDVQDNATPCGNSLAARALQFMARYSGETAWLEISNEMLSSIQSSAVRYPTAFGNWLCAIDVALSETKEIAILGARSHPNTQALIAVLWKTFRPHIILAASALPLPHGAPPLLFDRAMLNDLPTAYVCRNFTCLKPVITPQELLQQLDEQPFSQD